MKIAQLTIRQLCIALVSTVMLLAVMSSVATAARAGTPDAPFDASRFFAWPQGHAKEANNGLNLESHLRLSDVHNVATGNGAVIAVLDTGFDLNHPDLVTRYLPGADFVDGDEDPSEAPNGLDDDNDGETDEALGHGTYVAGVAAQVAPGASIIPIRVLDADGLGTVQAVVDGIEFARQSGATVINLSFGSGQDFSAVNQVVASLPPNVVVVAAAGNTENKARQYPAASPLVIGVAAYDPATKAVADFGTSGNWIDVSAPGVDIVTTRPGGSMGVWSGSSAATPVVAAQAALLQEQNPQLTAEQIRLAIVDSANREGGARRTARGVVDIEGSLVSERAVTCRQSGGVITVSSTGTTVILRKNNTYLTAVRNADLTDALPEFADATFVNGDRYVAVVRKNGTAYSASCTDEPGLVASPDISLVVRVNGDDAGNSPGRSYTVDQVASFTYEVRNTGTVPLSEVVVTNTAQSPVACPTDVLGVGDSFTCTSERTLVFADIGPVSHGALAIANTPDDGRVDDTDDANFTVVGKTCWSQRVGMVEDGGSYNDGHRTYVCRNGGFYVFK